MADAEELEQKWQKVIALCLLADVLDKLCVGFSFALDMTDAQSFDVQFVLCQGSSLVTKDVIDLAKLLG